MCPPDEQEQPGNTRAGSTRSLGQQGGQNLEQSSEQVGRGAHRKVRAVRLATREMEGRLALSSTLLCNRGESQRKG